MTSNFPKMRRRRVAELSASLTIARHTARERRHEFDESAPEYAALEKAERSIHAAELAIREALAATGPS